MTKYGSAAGPYSRRTEAPRKAPPGLDRPCAAWRKASFRGSTLVETLVMMLVAGIVFLTVMDGMTLFTRLQTQRARALASAVRRSGGYTRVVPLVGDADSILCPAAGRLELYRNGRLSALSHVDSVLVYRCGGFCDTLLGGVSALRLAEYDAVPDTVEIGFGVGFTAKLPVMSASRQYRMALDEIENGYGYEE